MIFRQLLDSTTWSYAYLLADPKNYLSRKRQAVITVCPAGARSAQAALILEQAGFTRVANLPGGLFRWLGLGFPVLQPEPPGLPHSR